jgi:hypothetical protein
MANPLSQNFAQVELLPVAFQVALRRRGLLLTCISRWRSLAREVSIVQAMIASAANATLLCWGMIAGEVKFYHAVKTE